MRDLNSSVDSTDTTEAGSSFQMGMVQGKNEYFRASEYVRYLVRRPGLSQCRCRGQIFIPLNSNCACGDFVKEG